jgi:VWFA-related protein
MMRKAQMIRKVSNDPNALTAHLMFRPFRAMRTLRGSVFPSFRVCLVAVTLLVAGPALLAGQSPAPQRAPVFRTATSLVRVDVIVRDKNGEIVRGLKAADFVVTEDGKAQTVTSFDFEEITTEALPPLTAVSVFSLEQLQAAATSRVVTVAGPPPAASGSTTAAAGATAPTAPAPASATSLAPEALAGRRMVILLFDTSSMQPEEVDRAVKSANEYIDKQMTPADLVALASVGQSLTILRDFTADRDQLKIALSAFDLTAGTGFEQPAGVDAVVDDTTVVEDPADLPLDDSEFGIFNNDRRLRAMRVLCEALAPIEQKKALLYFSSGMSRSGSDNQVELRAVTNTCNKANTSIYPVDSRGLTAVVPGGGAGGRGGRGGGGSSVFSGRSMVSAYSSLNTSQETLTTLAADTGGQEFLNSNDFGPAFTRVQRDMSAYYLLGYRSANVSKDGKFRKIAVKLKAPASGYRVDARPGYYASVDFAHLAKQDREKQLQEEIGSAVSSTDLPVVATTTWFRLANDRYYVPVSVAVPGSFVRVPTAEQLDRKNASLDLLGVVTDEQGRAVGRIRDTMQIPANQTADLADKQLQYQSGVTLPAGHFKVKVAVRENADGMMGTFEFPISIPDLKTTVLKVSPIVLSTQLRFTRGGGPGGRGGPGGPGGGGRGGDGGRGFQSQRGGGGPMWNDNASVNPLLRGGQEIVQSLSHVVTLSQRMYFYFEVYDPALDASGAPKLQASLAFYRGRVKVFETPVVARTQMDAPDRKAVIFQLQLPAADFKPGLYTCQVNLIDEISGTFAFPRIAVYVKEK